jgi:hypothetical protein
MDKEKDDAMDLTEAWVILTRETGLSRREWRDILSLPKPMIRQTLQTYKDANWTRPGTPAWKLVLQALPIVGQAMGLFDGALQARAFLKAG